MQHSFQFVLLTTLLLSPPLTTALYFANTQDSLKWKDRPVSHAHSWLSATDRCVLKHAKFSWQLPHVYHNVCKSSYFPEWPHRFGIGFGQRSGWGNGTRNCVPPYSKKVYFNCELVGYPLEIRVDLLTSLSELSSTNRTLVFAGDSLTRQSFDSFTAEVMQLAPTCTIHPYAPHLGYKPLPAHIVLHNQMLIDGQLLSGSIALEAVVIECDRLPHLFTVFYLNYRNVEDWNMTQHRLEELARRFDGMVLIVNHGIWQHTPKFTEEVLLYLDHFTRLEGKRIHALWRETTAGHFPSKSGYRGIEVTATECVAHVRNTTVAPDTPHVLSVLGSLNNPRIGFLFFFQATKPLHAMHITTRLEQLVYFKGSAQAPASLDCLHYCWWPALWQPLWAAIHDITHPPDGDSRGRALGPSTSSSIVAVSASQSSQKGEQKAAAKNTADTAGIAGSVSRTGTAGIAWHDVVLTWFKDNGLRLRAWAHV